MDFISKNIDTVLTIISAFVLPSIGFMVFQLFRRPRLEIEAFKMSGRRRGEVTNYHKEAVEPPFAEKLNYLYNFEISFEFSILNNSEIDGYDAEIEFNGLEGINIKTFGSLKFSPIPAHGNKYFQGRIILIKEAGYYNPPEISDVQREIRDKLTITSKVLNKYRFKNFYSIFDGKENQFKLIKPKA